LNLESSSLHALIDAVLNGNKDAYARIVGAHQDMLMAYAAFRIPDGDLVDEVVHQTFIRAYEQLELFQRDKDFGQWLRTICKYMIMAELKKFTADTYNKRNYGEHIRSLLAQNAMEEEDTDDGDTARMLGECMKSLPERSRMMLDLRYGEKLPASEISSRFEQSVGWVATTLFRVRGELRRCIEQRMKATRILQLRSSKTAILPVSQRE
jgi:RNA polymerase sigma-70 factor (ECF subfamily)